MAFANRDAARNFVVATQLARRNLSSEGASYLRGMRYLTEKLAHGGDRRAQASVHQEHLKTAERLAREFCVSQATVRRDGCFARAVEVIAGNCGAGVKKPMLARDGGFTNGYGHYWPYGGAVPPETITTEQADVQFAQDLEQRAARWVRAYVSAPLTQNQFDALVSMAFNLKPSSFKTIANAVNDGQDPEDAALEYVRAGTSLEAGLRNRRAREIALYRTGTYA